MQVTILDAKKKLSKLVEAALNGEYVVIARNGKPVAQLIPYETKGGLTGFGSLKLSQSQIDDAFSPETEKLIADMFYDKRS